MADEASQPRSAHTHTLCWSRIKAAGTAPPPRSGAASFIIDHKLWVFGGYGGGTGRLDDFHYYDLEKNEWQAVQVEGDRRPGCRENNGVVIAENEIILFGGYNGVSWLNDLWKFDLSTRRWTCIQESSPERSDMDDEDESNIPCPRFGYVSVVSNGSFILWGGFDGSRWLNDMHVFDLDGSNTWKKVEAKGVVPSARSCPAFALNTDESRLLIHGGFDGVDRKADFFSFDLRTYTWNEIPCVGRPPKPRYFHSCALNDNKLFVYGGFSGTERLSDMYCFDFDLNHWSEVACTSGDRPGGRSSLVAQIHNNHLYVFGGYNGEHVLNDFYKLRLKSVGIPPTGLTKDLCKLINSPELADVCFDVEGKHVFAHKAILAVRSEYFRVMLCGGMREGSAISGGATTTTSDGTPIPLVKLQGVSHEVFLKVLEFLYTDNTKSVSIDIGIHLLIASELFMLDRLKCLCEDLIRRDIRADNVVPILLASHRHNATTLKDIAFQYILSNLNNATVSANLQHLTIEPDLLLEIIKRKSAVETGSEAMDTTGPLDAGRSEWRR